MGQLQNPENREISTSRARDFGLWLCQFWMRILCFMFVVDVRIRFLQKNMPETGLILASNHFSNLDPPLLLMAYPYKFSAIAKKQLLKIPFVGSVFRDRGTISIDRSAFGPSTVRQAMEQIKVSNLLFFPEGTRSPEGKIRQGKQGFGYLVAKTGAPVVPVFINAASILPKHRFLPTPGTVEIIFGHILTFEEISAKIGNLNEKEAYREISSLIMSEIARLKDLAEKNESPQARENKEEVYDKKQNLTDCKKVVQQEETKE